MNSPTLIRQATPPASPSPASASPGVGTHDLGDLKTAAKDQMVQSGADLKQGAQEALHAAKEAGTDFISDQKGKLAAKIDELTEAVKAASERLKDDASNPLAGPAEKASRQLERAANYLREKGPAEFLDDLGTLARRRPEVFFGGLFIVGLATARFLKASAPAAKSIRSAHPPAARGDAAGRPGVSNAPEIGGTHNEKFPS